MNDTDGSLKEHLLRLRREAGLTVEQVCERTKIQSRFVRALEEGRFGELPSNAHLRAFSLALAQVCGGDSEQTALWVRRTLASVAAPGATDGKEPSLTPSQRGAGAGPLQAQAKGPLGSPLAAAAIPAAPGIALRRPDPARLAAHEAAQAAEGLLQGASQRLKALPWQALLVLAGGASLLSVGLLWGVHHWRQQLPVTVPGTSAQAGPGEPAAAEKSAEKAPLKAGAKAEAVQSTAMAAPVPAAELTLRARRPCWLVIQIDGQRLPTVTMQDGDKRSWPVSQKAVLLAGNIGALRVWWRGENLGYLGELGNRVNGLVFEPGKPFRVDSGVRLPLPAGVPE